MLKSIDFKIANNSALSKTLEEIAQTIFKSWFIDFDPVKAKMAGEKPVGMDDATAALFPDSMEDSELGPIPKGWNVKSLDAIASAFGDSVARLGLSGWVLRAVVLGTVVTVLAGAAMIAVPHADTARHEIGGIVLYEGKPLANGVIEFHRADAVDPADSLQLAIHADSKGIFRAASTDGLPTGRFAVVIRSGSLATARPRDRRIEAVIPSKYQDPASSPLRVSVLEANVGMKFAVHK